MPEMPISSSRMRLAMPEVSIFLRATSSMAADTSKARTSAPRRAARMAIVPVPHPISRTLEPGRTFSSTSLFLHRSAAPRDSNAMPRS